MRFRHAKQVQSPVPWPAAILTPTLNIPTLLPAGCLNILVFHDAKHPSTAACLPQCQASQHHFIPTMVQNIPAPLSALTLPREQHHNPADSGPQSHRMQGDVGLFLHNWGAQAGSRIWGLQGQQHLWDAGKWAAPVPPALRGCFPSVGGSAAPSAPCGPRRGTVPPPRPSPWGGAEWEPHGGAARNSKAFGKGGSPAGWESGSVISAESELCSQPASSQPRVLPRGGAAPGAGHPLCLADGVPSPSISPALGNQ